MLTKKNSAYKPENLKLKKNEKTHIEWNHSFVFTSLPNLVLCVSSVSACKHKLLSILLGCSPGGSREFEAGMESAIKEGLIRNLKRD